MAAEIATVAPQFFNKVVLVGAMGIKPEQGEIFDYFLWRVAPVGSANGHSTQPPSRDAVGRLHLLGWKMFHMKSMDAAY
jgi:hypothetical protein